MKKIMFNEHFGLQQSVLYRTKDMTRRVIKGDYIEVAHSDEGTFIGKTANGESVILPQPAYNVGEEVAVAQRYANDDVLTFNAYDSEGQPRKDGCKCHQEMLASPGYRNKMFVKAEYMPHRIRITDIKVERLQDISEEECLKEGVEKWIDCYIVTGIMENQGKNNVCFDTPREAFAALIDRISGKGTWQRNPWVFAYTFKLLR